ncbi:MAG: class I SAM-dependent methyltransferase [Caldilineaceae bacterium]|nr:class I SAM-dependent methyltransferase [Caldilineaceae bacterium]
MELQEGIALIRNEQVTTAGPQRWADLGCGTGFFTDALARLLPVASLIYAVDKSATLPRRRTGTKSVAIEPLRLDFVRDRLPVEPLDGILMANSLHYVRDQLAFLQQAQRYLKPQHHFLIVEYELERANPWVPYPLSYHTLTDLFAQAGYTTITKLHERTPVRGADTMYGALISR